jgi:hypothetical protein
MSGERHSDRPAEPGAQPSDPARSGEGAKTALEALIRKRKQQGGDAADDNPEAPDAPALS